MRKVLLALLVLGALAFGASAANASIANFQITLRGKFETSSTVTESGCYTLDADGNEVPAPSRTGTATETDAFSSPSSSVFQVSHIRGELIGSGPVHRNKDLPVRVTTTRSSTLDGGTGVAGCRPSASGPGDPQADCGTKTERYQVDVIGPILGRTQELTFSFVRAHSYLYLPGDPFENCWLSDSQRWFGGAPRLYARASVSKLFNPRVHRLVLHGHTTRRFSGGGFSEQFALTLTRVKGTTVR